MICERCGNDFADTVTICPRCGTLKSQPHIKQSVTDYGAFAPSNLDNVPFYQQGYVPPLSGTASPHTQYVPPGSPFPSAYSSVPPHPIDGVPSRIVVVTPNSRMSALTVEILLSLFGIFGIGWIIGGEITLGIILIVCSFFIYWPLVIVGTALTEGLGLICMGPLAIAAIILNAIVLNTVLKRKAHRLRAIQHGPYYRYPPTSPR